MFARSFAISMSLLAVTSACILTVALSPDGADPETREVPRPETSAPAKAGDSRLVVTNNTVTEGILLRSSYRDWVKVEDRVPVDVRLWLVPPDDDHRLRLTFRLTNHTDSDVVLSRQGKCSLDWGSTPTLWIHPEVPSKTIVPPGEEWSGTVSIQFGVDLPYPNTPDWKLHARITYSHPSPYHDFQDAVSDLTLPVSAESPCRLDQVVEAARQAAQENYPDKGRIQPSRSLYRVKGGWALRHRVRGVSSVVVVLSPDGTVHSHHFRAGCVFL